ncbi:hypothetical protein BGW80DRAFT_1310943 [Lactifluus volemus]|nr:hypothetical protein BGW80DRAFT_1310943 [Lactifluus volemus]
MSTQVPASSSGDAATDLNNYLQNHPLGNLTIHFNWVMTREGPDNSVVHIATAMYRGTAVGQGRGVSKGAAKRVAAAAVLTAFRANGVPEP